MWGEMGDFSIAAIPASEAAYFDWVQAAGLQRALCANAGAIATCSGPVRYVGGFGYPGALERRLLFRRYYCRTHAQAFAERHGLPFPPREAPP